MVALPGVLRAGDVGVEHPAPHQVRAVEVVGGHDGAGVVAAADQQAGVLPVEVGGAGQEPVHAVAVAVAPGGDVPARRGVVDGVEGLAGGTLEHREELRAGQDVAGGVAVVGVRVADDLPRAVDGAVGGLEDHLGPVLTAEELGVAKPRPAAFLAACERLGVPPAATLHVGDEHAVDVLGARAAGLRAVHVDRTGTGPADEVARVGSLRELAAHLA
ncbi:HAD-IA family hydrolase [Kineococcus sp. T90]|nr:HAD-IA family hydrolase [Kineococcus indalonis]